MRRNNPAGTGMRGKRFAPRRCRDTNSDPRRIAETVWIFSRAEWVALATTERTDKMPGGMARLNHVSKYKAVWLNVQNSFQRSAWMLARNLVLSRKDLPLPGTRISAGILPRKTDL